ncbi:hypothetical protein QTN25_000784 [Entamoeba marina]
MGLFDIVDIDNDIDMKFLHDNVHVLNNWTGLRCKEIVVDSLTDLWMPHKSYILANYVQGKSNVMYAMFLNTLCFGFYTTEPLLTYTNDFHYMKKGNEFFTFELKQSANLHPNITFLRSSHSDTFGIFPPNSTSKIIELKEGFVLNGDMSIKFHENCMKLYGLKSIQDDVDIVRSKELLSFVLMNHSEKIISLFNKAIAEEDGPMLEELCKQFGMVTTLRSSIWKILLRVKPQRLPRPLHLRINEAEISPIVEKLITTIDASKRKELLIDSYSIAASLIQPKTSPNFVPTVLIALVFYYLFPEEIIEFRLGAVQSFISSQQPYYSHLYPSIQKGLHCLMHILLQYHDPELCHCLDSFRVEPTYYTIRFLYNALFPTGESINDVLTLWDEFILNSDKDLFYYAVISYLIEIRDDILKENKKTSLLNLIRSKRIGNEQIKIVLCRANSIRKHTLTSFKLLLQACFLNEEMFQRWYAQSLSSTLALPVEITTLLKDKQTNFEVLFIDCRVEEIYNGGTIDKAINFDFTRREDRDYVDGFFASKETAILREGNKNAELSPTLSELTMIMLDFIKRGVKYLGVLLSGYFTFHRYAMNRTTGFKLAHHNPSICEICTPPQIAKFQKKIQFLGQSTKKISERATSWIASFSSPNRVSSSTPTQSPQPKKTKTPINPIRLEKDSKNESSAPHQPETKVEQLIDVSGSSPMVEPTKPIQPLQSNINNDLLFKDMPIQPLPIGSSNNLFIEDDGEDDEMYEESNYFDELMKESPTYEGEYNVVSGEAVDCWKKCIAILSAVDLLIAEKPSGDGEMFLLEEIMYSDIQKITSKPQSADITTLHLPSTTVTLRIPKINEFLHNLNDRIYQD